MPRATRGVLLPLKPEVYFFYFVYMGQTKLTNRSVFERMLSIVVPYRASLYKFFIPYVHDAAITLYITAVVDAPSGLVTLGANMANGVEQKGIDTLQQCIKKCASAGLGIPATVCTKAYYLLVLTSFGSVDCRDKSATLKRPSNSRHN